VNSAAARNNLDTGDLLGLLKCHTREVRGQMCRFDACGDGR